MKRTLSIIAGIIICVVLGYLGSLSQTTSLQEWYPLINKSSLTPPGIVFSIMWGILYTLTGISVGIIYSSKDISSKKTLLLLFAVQLALNYSWNILFFYLQNPMWGLINLLLLDILAIIFFMATFKRKRSAALFFLPYTIWILFATYLNLYILINN